MDFQSIIGIGQGLFTLLNQPFVAAIPPTIALYFTYKQLKQIENTDKKQDEKLAVENSIKYVDRFSNVILPHLQQYKTLIADKEIKTIEIPGTGFTNFEHSEEPSDLERKEITGIYQPLNELDTIAAAVLYGQVDKSITRELFGSLFCEAVEVYYDLICYSRIENQQHFKMTVQLYKEWRSTFTKVQSPVNKHRNNSLQNKINTDEQSA